MDIIHWFLDLTLNLDDHLLSLVNTSPFLTYVLLFAIIYSETGLVVFPFLPGDSLVFAAGATVAVSAGALHIVPMLLLLTAAAFLGNMTNYSIGRFIGPRIFERDTPLIKKKHLVSAKEFYDKHGVRAIIISRFLPYVRTFVPFIAGIVHMNWSTFTFYNFISAVIWIVPFCLAGYWLGNFPWVKEHFGLIVLGFIVVTFIPLVSAYIKSKLAKKA